MDLEQSSLEQETVLPISYHPFTTPMEPSDQVRFHNDRYDILYRLISAGTGSGKTASGLAEAIYWTFECPGSVGLICEPTYGMLQRILLAETIPQIMGYPLESNPVVREFNKSRNQVDFVNGSRWWLMGLEDPEKVEGPNLDWIWADEFRLVGGSGEVARVKQELCFQVFQRRLRGSVTGRALGYPTGLWITTTPDFPKTVLWEKFEGNDKSKMLPGRKIYRWSIDANPYTRREWKEGVKASHVPGTGLYNRFVLGLFATAGVGSFAFDGSVHIVKKEQIPDPVFIKKTVYGVDFGWTNPASIIPALFDGDGRVWVPDEFYQSRVGMETLIKEGKRLMAEHGNGDFICDRSAPQNIEEMQRGGLPAKADESKRDEGIAALAARFPLQGDMKPRIFIVEHCVSLIDELQAYDENVKENDHAVDALRYAISEQRMNPQLGLIFRAVSRGRNM